MDLAERVARLERSARRWRAATVVLLAIIGIGAVVAAAPAGGEPQTLKVKGVQVVNDAGEPVVVLGSGKGGGQIHVVSAQTRKPAFSAGAGGIVVTSPDGLGSVGVSSTGKSLGLIVTNPAGQNALMLYPDEKGAGHVSLFSADGKSVVWEAPPR